MPQTALLSSTHTCMFRHVELVTDCSVCRPEALTDKSVLFTFKLLPRSRLAVYQLHRKRVNESTRCHGNKTKQRVWHLYQNRDAKNAGLRPHIGKSSWAREVVGWSSKVHGLKYGQFSDASPL